MERMHHIPLYSCIFLMGEMVGVTGRTVTYDVNVVQTAAFNKSINRINRLIHTDIGFFGTIAVFVPDLCQVLWQFCAM